MKAKQNRHWVVWHQAEGDIERACSWWNEAEASGVASYLRDHLHEKVRVELVVERRSLVSAKIGVGHVRTVDAERKNKNLFAEVQSLMLELDAVKSALGDVLRDCHSKWMDTPAVKRAQDVYERIAEK